MKMRKKVLCNSKSKSHHFNKRQCLAVWWKWEKKFCVTQNQSHHFKMSHLTTKPTTWQVLPAKSQISLGIRPVWSVFAICMNLATHWVHSQDSDQTGRMPRPIWVFAGCIVILLVLSWGSSKCLNVIFGILWNSSKHVLWKNKYEFLYFIYCCLLWCLVATGSLMLIL